MDHRSRRRFKRPIDKAGTIERPKAKYRDDDNRVGGRDLIRTEQPAMIGLKRGGARATRSLAVISQNGQSGGVEMKGDKDWQRVPGILTDRLVVKVSPRAVRIVFGQVGETEVSFHAAVVMTRRNAAALAEAIQKLSAKSKGPDVRKATVSGGQVH